MREVPRDKGLLTPDEARQKVLEAQQRVSDAQNGPSETELVIIALLMRLYDLNLAQLASVDADRADEVYEAHSKGEHFNPQVFIPQFTRDENGNESTDESR